MGTVVAQTLINRAAFVLEDTSNRAWSRAELLSWLNEAQGQVVTFAPQANPVRQNLSLVAGTYQTLPERTSQLLDIPRNVNGPAVRMTTRELLDGGPFDWHTAKPSAIVRNYVYDSREPEAFYVYPPNTGGGQLVVVISANPQPITNESSAIEVHDNYEAAILNYMLYRAYSKDTDHTLDTAKASSFYSAFRDALAGDKEGGIAAGATTALGPMNSDSDGSLR